MINGDYIPLPVHYKIRSKSTILHQKDCYKESVSGTSGNINSTSVLNSGLDPMIDDDY